MSKGSFEEILQREGRLIYTSVGDSMLPLIRPGRDLLVIERREGRLKKYDVPLYRRTSGQYVLHRILRVREDGYVLCGDNRWRKETGVTDGQILGVLTAVVRSGREISMDDWRCRLYARVWCGLFPLRALVLRGIHRMKRMMKR